MFTRLEIIFTAAKWLCTAYAYRHVRMRLLQIYADSGIKNKLLSYKILSVILHLTKIKVVIMKSKFYS